MMSQHTFMNYLANSRPCPALKEDRDVARLLRSSSPQVARPAPSLPPHTPKRPRSTIKQTPVTFKVRSRADEVAGPSLDLASSPTLPRSQVIPTSLGSPPAVSYLPSPPTSPSRLPRPVLNRKRKSHDHHDGFGKELDGQVGSPSKKRVVVDIRRNSSQSNMANKLKTMSYPPSPSLSTSSTLCDEPSDPSEDSKEPSTMPLYNELLAAHLELKAAYAELEAKYAADTLQPDSLKDMLAQAIRQGLEDEREAEKRRGREVRARRGLVARALAGASMAYSALRLGRGLYRDGMWVMGRVAYGKAQLGGLPAAWDLVAMVQERVGFF
ncbi:hypothetical protein JCM8208_005948 [Rhodotorula glutinis]